MTKDRRKLAAARGQITKLKSRLSWTVATANKRIREAEVRIMDLTAELYPPVKPPRPNPEHRSWSPKVH